MLKAREVGNFTLEYIHKQRSVRITKQMKEDLKKSLILLGIKVIQAESDAEALSSYLCKEKILDFTATEDIDALTFGCPFWIKGLNQGSKDILLTDLSQLLTQMNFTMKMFVDLCILCGCDYSNSVKGIGPVNGFKLLTEFHDIEGVIQNIQNSKKFQVPEKFEYEDARDVFQRIYKPVEVSESKFQPEEASNFLIKEKNFNPERVNKVLESLSKYFN